MSCFVSGIVILIVNSIQVNCQVILSHLVGHYAQSLGTCSAQYSVVRFFCESLLILASEMVRATTTAGLC